MLSAVVDLASHPLEHVRVGDCLSSTLLTCDGDASLTEVARLLSQHRVHALLVGDHSISVVTDRDVIAAIGPGRTVYARDIAVEALTVPASASLRQAAMLLTQHHATHLIAVDEAAGRPVGILSDSDILAVYAAIGSAA